MLLKIIVLVRKSVGWKSDVVKIRWLFINIFDIHVFWCKKLEKIIFFVRFNGEIGNFKSIGDLLSLTPAFRPIALLG